jgi:hypothetical protein
LGSPDDTLKQKILNDAKKNNNQVIVVFSDLVFANGQNNVVFVFAVAF